MSASPSSTLPTSDRLQTTRNSLLTSQYYIGKPGVSDQLTWFRFGKEDCVVTREALETFHSSNNAPDLEPLVPAPPDPVELSAVVLITPDDFWLTSCGMWKGPTSVARTLADVKPTCTGDVPQETIFAQDFDSVMENINSLVHDVQINEQTEVKGFFKNSPTGQRKIKFRHILFEKIQHPSDGGYESSDTEDGKYLLIFFYRFRAKYFISLQIYLRNSGSLDGQHFTPRLKTL